MNRVNKSKKVIKITAIILVILIILGIALTEGIGSYFVNYAIARSGAGGDRKVSEETKIEIQGEDEKIIENNRKLAKESSKIWSEESVQKTVEIVAKRKAKYDIKEASALEQVKKSKTPILFIHGSNDDFVPEYMCEKLFNAANCEKEKLIINGAGHTDGKYRDPETYYNKIFE